MTKNPWEEISVEKKILDIDKDVIKKHNQKFENNEQRKLSVDDYPEPFLGNPDSEIYILLANPGRNIKTELSTIELVKKESLENTIIKNLNHDFKDIEYPFYFLDPKFENHPGAKWWNKALEKLIINDISKRKKLANQLFGIELYGYHSVVCERRLINNKERLPSSQYSYHLVRKAIKEEKIILLARAVGDWFDKVPELKDYDNCYFIANNRGIKLSKKTISPKAYKEINRIINSN